MNEIFFINTFFNIVYRNESAYMRDLLMSYDYIYKVLFNGFANAIFRVMFYLLSQGMIMHCCHVL